MSYNKCVMSARKKCVLGRLPHSAGNQIQEYSTDMISTQTQGKRDSLSTGFSVPLRGALNMPARYA